MPFSNHCACARTFTESATKCIYMYGMHGIPHRKILNLSRYFVFLDLSTASMNRTILTRGNHQITASA